MPGINIFFDVGGVSKFGTMIDKAHKSMEYFEGYSVKILENTDRLMISITEHEYYPIRILESKDFKIIIEGIIAGIYDDEPFNSEGFTAFSDEKALQKLVEQIVGTISSEENAWDSESSENFIISTDLSEYNRILRRIEGQFLITVYSVRKRRLIIFGSLMGHYPLYYKIIKSSQNKPSGIIISRDLSFINRLDFDGIDNMGIAQYLFFTFTLQDRTLFRNVKKAPKGGVIALSWRPGGSEASVDPNTQSPDNLPPEEDKTRERLLHEKDITAGDEFEAKIIDNMMRFDLERMQAGFDPIGGVKVTVKPDRLLSLLKRAISSSIGYTDGGVRDSDGKIIMSMSGGFDSRAVFYGILSVIPPEMRNRISVVSFIGYDDLNGVYRIDDSDNIDPNAVYGAIDRLRKEGRALGEGLLDLYVSIGLSRKYGLSHKIIVIRNDSVDDYENMIIRIKNGIQSVLLWPIMEYLTELVKITDNRSLLLTGDSGFSFRPLYTGMPVRKDADLTEGLLSFKNRYFILHAFPLESALEIAGIGRKEFIEEISAIFKSYPERSPQYKFIRFFFENYVFNWHYEGMDRSRYFVRVYYPLESTPLLYTSFFHPFKNRSKFKLYRRILRGLDEHSLDAIISNYNCRIGGVKGKILLFKKGLKEYFTGLLKSKRKYIPESLYRIILRYFVERAEFSRASWYKEIAESADVIKKINPQLTEPGAYIPKTPIEREYSALKTVIMLIKMLEHEGLI